MAKYSIPVLPNNYAVFYNHVAGVNEKLSAEIERLIEADELDEAVTRRLFREFLQDGEMAKLQEAREAICTLAQDVSGTIKAADDEVTRYEQSLQSASSEAEQPLDQQQLQGLLGKLAESTHQMHETGLAMQQSLEDSRREAEQLRVELDEARQAAKTDALTRLANRAAFDEFVERLPERTPPDSPGHCLLLADIDKFKSINDTYGHLLGDKVIKVVASTIKDAIKGGDLPCRFGGEEFAILLPHTNLDGAIAVAENIRKALERSRIVKPKTGEALRQVTISIGVTQLSTDGSIDDALARADAALYNAKEGGRNRVAVHGSVGEAPIAQTA